MWAVPVYAQDGLARAKSFYASASYEEALAVLDSLHGKTPPAESTEASMYEVFCLVALGRNDDARRAMETIVRTDPEYRLTDAQASPRVRAMFETVRQPLLAGIVRESYAKGREALDGKDLPTAIKNFDRVIAVVSQLEPIKDDGLRDLKTLATGFRDLAKAALEPKPAPPPADSAAKATDPAAPSTPAAPPAPKVEPRRVFGPADADVKPPTAISQVLPPWRPESVIEQKIDYHGYIDLLIDEQGRVQSAAIVRSIHPRYDPVLLDAARRWTFRPAVRAGRPVQYRYSLEINLIRH
jgi:hypothetical protein